MRNVKKVFLVITLCLIVTSGFSFGSEPENAGNFSFVQLCDPQLGFGGYEHDVNSFQIAVKKINELEPDFVVICGDMVNTFDEKSLSDFNDIKNDLKMPCYCCPGNHDVENTPTVESLKKYRDFFGKDYFAFEHKGYTFVMTDTNIIRVPVEGETQKQDSWIKETINAAHEKKSPVFVIGHHPMYTRTPDEPYGNNSLPVEKRKELLELFENSGVVAILTAHTHQSIINDYNGIQLVTGETTSRNLDGRPFGFRLWNISPDSIKHEFISLGMPTPASNRRGRR
ncbi:MAG: metallophosphoesterase [Sedimentisphaerales bacterium]|nr:metallophosphoesterase [Sedimentisphaerales bacterium]